MDFISKKKNKKPKIVHRAFANSVRQLIFTKNKNKKQKWEQDSFRHTVNKFQKTLLCYCEPMDIRLFARGKLFCRHYMSKL